MAAIRTQIYLTPAMRERIDVIMRREHKALAQIVRDALDAYLAADLPDPDAALASTFGAMPDLRVPDRGEWDRG